MNSNSIPTILQPGGFSETGAGDQYNVLLWTSLASRILGLPARPLND
jgi:hypothetical protein